MAADVIVGGEVVPYLKYAETEVKVPIEVRLALSVAEVDVTLVAALVRTVGRVMLADST